MRANKRGFTLLEILVVSAIAAILVVTAAALLVTMSSQRAANRKRLDRLTQSFSAMTLLERSMLNAGYHFPASRFGFRVYNNVSGATFGPGSSPTCMAQGCVVDGSDVLETVEGNPGPFGLIIGANNSAADGGSGSTWNVFVSPPGGPLDTTDTAQHLFIFASMDGRSCAGIGTVADGVLGGMATQYAVTMVDRDLAAVSATYYSPSSAAPHNFMCPESGMSVAVAQSRRRYMVLAQDGGTTRGLYMQTGDPLNLNGGDAGLELLAFGIDNFQVVPLAALGDAGFTAGCVNGVCECNAPGTSCQIVGASNDQEFSDSRRVIGVRVGLSARGETEDRISATAGVVPDRLGDETMSADRIKRTSQTQTYMFRNFAQVQP